MGLAGQPSDERRGARRYPVHGPAALRWPGSADARVALEAAGSLVDVSSQGCGVAGRDVPPVGERVSVRFDLRGIPGLLLDARTVRRVEHAVDKLVGLEFRLRKASRRGLERLLASSSHARSLSSFIMISERDEGLRGRLAGSIRALGGRAVGVGNAIDAVSAAQHFRPTALVCRADDEGLATFAAFSEDFRDVFRVAYGDPEETQRALSLGYADALTEDPFQPGRAKHLHFVH